MIGADLRRSSGHRYVAESSAAARCGTICDIAVPSLSRHSARI
jgi:hypothetical protein